MREVHDSAGGRYRALADPVAADKVEPSGRAPFIGVLFAVLLSVGFVWAPLAALLLRRGWLGHR